MFTHGTPEFGIYWTNIRVYGDLGDSFIDSLK